MSGTAAARGLAKANPLAEEFFRTLKDFLAARDKLNKAALDFMPTNGAAAFDDVGGDVVLRQDLGGTAAVMDPQLDALYARAAAAKEALDAFCRRLAADAGLDPDQEMLREARDGGDKILRAYSAGPLKSRKRAVEKATNEYDGDAARLIDVVRGSIVCGDEASLVAVLKCVLEGFSDEAGDVCVVRSKNRFKKPLFNGYRDVLFNLRLRLPDGTSMVVELQVHLVKILEFKATTHVYYEYFRTYFSGNLVVVAERMTVLEAIADDGGDASAGLADAVERAVKARDAAKLKAFDDLLGKLAAYDLLAVVRECLRDMALTAHGDDSVEHSFALNNLALLLTKQGKLDAAEPLYRRSLEIKEKLLGPDNPGVALSLSNLAGLLKAQGKLEAAEQLYRRALEIKQTYFGPDHPDVGKTMNGLGVLLKAQGKLDAAEPLYRRAIEIYEKKLGSDHLDVAKFQGNLASLLEDQGKLDAAEELYRRALAVKEKQLGPHDPSVGISLHNLAGLLKTQGLLDAAEPLYHRALVIKEIQLGPDHTSLATSLNGLASLLKAQGKHDAAEPLYRRALAIFERQRRPDVVTLHNLASLLEDMKKIDEAEPLYRRAIEIKEKQLGPDHTSVATSLHNLAGLLKKQGKFDDAEPLYRRVIEIKEKKLGPDHTSVAASLSSLVALLKAQGKLDAAEPLSLRALEIKEKQVGPDHASLATPLNNHALLLWRLGRLDAALPLQERATSIKANAGDGKEAEYRGEMEKMRKGAKYPYKQ